jgi:hypothetical protein
LLLHFVIGVQFGNLIVAANSALSPLLPNPPQAARGAEFLIDHIVSEMTAPSAAGVIRATIKLATIRPEAVKKFEEYRTTVSNHAIAILHNRLSKGISRDTIRVAVQIVMATVTDSVLQENPGPMSAGSRRMKSALANVFVGYLGISNDKKWAGTEADDQEGKVDNEIFSEPLSDDMHYDPKEQGFRRSLSLKSSKTENTKAAPERSSSTRTSQAAPTAESRRLPQRSRRRPRRKSRTI